jgi:DNA-binding GntR family transcriptional regulator
MERARRLGLAGRPFSERAAIQHRAIVEAIAARDPEQAEMRMREHIRYGLERVTSWLSGPGRHE